MSFGFGIGDFIAGAKLAYTLSKALSDARSSEREYRELIAQLDVVHKVLLQVNELHASNQLAKPTVNALLFTTNTANEQIEAFLDQLASYQDGLRVSGSGNLVKNIWYKGKWAIQMPDRAGELKFSLITMLSTVNCLVTLACYYNTAYDPRCKAIIEPDPQIPAFPEDEWRDIQLSSTLQGLSPWESPTYPFITVSDPTSFFRPGQVFATEIRSSLILDNSREFRDIDFGRLPLEPVPKLLDLAEKERTEDRQRRLEQLRHLPLRQMTAYCKQIPHEPRKVKCLVCAAKQPFGKDLWIWHFRFDHWQHYLAMVPESRCLRALDKWTRDEIIAPSSLSQLPMSSSFSAKEWIDLEDITDDNPVITDQDLVEKLRNSSLRSSCCSLGPILIQRFVVVREGCGICLCLGIHSYSRRGCGSQPDQEKFSIVHCGKEVPEPLADETAMRLWPIRMKPEHPSTVLPKTARIHFGRAHQVSHSVPVQPLGLVHPASMEELIDQFEANVPRRVDDDKESDSFSYSRAKKRRKASTDESVKPADLKTVQEIRGMVEGVLGANISVTGKEVQQRD